MNSRLNTRPTVQADLFALKEKLEQLFPGKWLAEPPSHRSLPTGIAEIDNSVPRGLARRRITEWIGPLSSGKTSLLRAIVARWCASGLNVVYVDKLARLRASDWTFVEKGNSGATASSMSPTVVKEHGRFWVVRNLKSDNHDRDALWATDQLIRSGAFDVVIFDAAGNFSLASRVYARLQRALDRSRAALLVLKDEDVHEDAEDVTQDDLPEYVREEIRGRARERTREKKMMPGEIERAPCEIERKRSQIERKGRASQSWGCHARFGFNWALPVSAENSLSGLSSLVPSTQCITWKDGLSKKIEVNFRTHVSNRLFTHPQIPDRRTPKA